MGGMFGGGTSSAIETSAGSGVRNMGNIPTNVYGSPAPTNVINSGSSGGSGGLLGGLLGGGSSSEGEGGGGIDIMGLGKQLLNFGGGSSAAQQQQSMVTPMTTGPAPISGTEFKYDNPYKEYGKEGMAKLYENQWKDIAYQGLKAGLLTAREGRMYYA
jgi:predicted lipid-binding transport protein (Tim44 family)